MYPVFQGPTAAPAAAPEITPTQVIPTEGNPFGIIDRVALPDDGPERADHERTRAPKRKRSATTDDVTAKIASWEDKDVKHNQKTNQRIRDFPGQTLHNSAAKNTFSISARLRVVRLG